MKIQPITPDNVQAFRESAKITFSFHYGGGINKSFEIDTHGNFIVLDHGKEIYKGRQINDAVDIYNQIERIVK